RTLEIIGRKHTAQQTKDAYLLARSLGFDNINMDLILGLPGENNTDVMHTMEEIKKLAPDDLTVHSLAIKRGSPLMERISEIERDRIVNTEGTVKITSDAAREMGLLPYYMYRQKNIAGNFENIGYSKKGKEGLYNVIIMEEVQTIIAIGAGTVSKKVDENGHIERTDSPKDIKLFLDDHEEVLKKKDILFE
ncbi:MAG: coproporphyrinogen dehydrogenase HemZ, partial [Lachnospiraceae bacterium]|nr:coproporphyrinogen dehydrogenase HemZ [Lachnospiraceae bacterium]